MDLPLEEHFVIVLEDIGALQTVEEEICDQNFEIYGYNRDKSYPEFNFNYTVSLDIPVSFLVDTVEPIDYGFLIEEGGSLVTGQDSAELILKDIIPNTFKGTITMQFVIVGDPKLIDIMTEHEFVVKLTIRGCSKHELFWKQSLYHSFLLYKEENLLSCFMHLYIAYEGFIKSHVYLEESMTGREYPAFWEYYKKYTGEKHLTKELEAFKYIRDQIMHGYENMTSKLTKEDIAILLFNINSLYKDHEPIKFKGKTRAIAAALKEKEMKKEKKKETKRSR